VTLFTASLARGEQTNALFSGIDCAYPMMKIVAQGEGQPVPLNVGLKPTVG